MRRRFAAVFPKGGAVYSVVRNAMSGPSAAVLCHNCNCFCFIALASRRYSAGLLIFQQQRVGSKLLSN